MRKKDTAVGRKKMLFTLMIHEDHHGPKGTSPKSGQEKTRKERRRKRISNIQHSITKVEIN
jgi:hypothetical protein